ncbi:MAG: hypothetical protein MI741_16850 [Rhodospirillales bacterium]|nr:hypothetical protein [Rhodospirillales bacterium]
MENSLQVAQPVGDTGVDLPPLNRRSLRTAFVLKEILDKPISMREQGGSFEG